MMTTETFGQRLKRLMEEQGISKARLARDSGVDRSYIYQILKDETTPGITTLNSLAKGLKRKPSILLGEVQPTPKTALSDLEVSIRAYIPVYAEVSAGEGVDPVDYVACTRVKPAPETMRAYRVKGLCLSPEINEGDTLIVDTARSPESGDLVVVIIDGQASVKRFKETEGNKWLENNNGTYRPEDVLIHGVVVEFNRKLRSGFKL